MGNNPISFLLDLRWSLLEVAAICILVITSLFLQMGALKGVKGAPLDPDVASFIALAQKMEPFSENGFYSARFGMREPLYLMVVKSFFMLPGLPEQNIRYVSFFFSLLVILLTYLLVRRWIGKMVGFTAALLLVFNTYWIELSTRGLRCEFVTSLFLLFIYWTCIRHTHRLARTIGAGILSGLLFLTRTEFILPAILFFLFLPLFERKHWHYTGSFAALLIGVILVMPHLWSMYKVNGDIFYTSNLGARFYTNLEFAGQTGFPTKAEIKEKGFLVGPRITPFDYFFRFRPFSHFIWGNIKGLAKIYLYLILRYIPTKTWNRVKHEKGTIGTWTEWILIHHPVRSIIAIAAGIGLLGGLLILWRRGYHSIYFILILFQAQTAFLFTKGLETQVVVHTWPVALWVAAFFLVQAASWVVKKGLPGIKKAPLQGEA